MPLVAPNHIEKQTGRLLETETAADQEAISGKYLCDAGDVIYSKIRPALRKACMCSEPSLCSADMYPIKVGPELEGEYLLYFLLTDAFSNFAVLESERVAMPKVNRETLADFPIAIPPLNEQSDIAQTIISHAAEVDASVQRIQNKIALLGERRSALISAAVTGQIPLAAMTPDVTPEDAA